MSPTIRYGPNTKFHRWLRQMAAGPATPIVMIPQLSEEDKKAIMTQLETKIETKIENLKKELIELKTRVASYESKPERTSK
jgi:chemotaxis response regulator CheB